MPLTPEVERAIKLEEIFMPHAAKLRRDARERQHITNIDADAMRFVHYTSADAALNILRTRRIWMRNSTCMADYKEVRHGFEILQRYFTPEKTKEFTDALDACMPGVAQKAIDIFNGWWAENSHLNIYITSVSLHDESEDRFGRLSMWRAFGAGATRVALVIKIPFYSGAAQELGMMFSPVAYLPEKDVGRQVEQVIKNVAREAAFLQPLGQDLITQYLFHMLFAGVTCLKHEGFREEQEWRAIYCPQINKSQLMELSVESVAGVPQHVHKIPLDGRVSEKLAGLDLPELVDRIIIGPSPYPWVLYCAFAEELEKLGVFDAREKVLVSDIPIRA